MLTPTELGMIDKYITGKLTKTERIMLDTKGEDVVETLSLENDWSIAVICADYLCCDLLIKKLITKFPQKFRIL